MLFYVNDTKREYRVVHPRIPADLHVQLAAYADRTHRSITNAIVHLLTIGLRAEGEGE